LQFIKTWALEKLLERQKGNVKASDMEAVLIKQEQVREFWVDKGRCE
jgi:tryptophan 2,3-dioxygenase